MSRSVSKINFICFQSGIVGSLKEILRNRTYYQSKKERERMQGSSAVCALSDKQAEKFKKNIQEEMEKATPSKTVLKENLSQCRSERQALAKKQSYGKHIEEFPCLKIPDVVSIIFLFTFYFS